ncbi:MAG: AI-2E family transporter, partial [Chloroflexota bacterium]
GYLAIGLRYPLLAALVVALSWAIPLVGGVIGLLAILLAGLLSGLPALIGGLLLTLAALAVLEFWLQPRLYRRDRFGMILVLVTMMIMGRAFGLIGLVTAPPLATAIQVLVNAALRLPGSAAGAAMEQQIQPVEQVIPDEWAALEERLARLRAAAEHTELPLSTQDLMERLAGLLEKTRTELKAD